jgi:hypothetical protein
VQRHLLSALLVVLLGATAGRAQDWARKMFTESSHDFGAVARDAKVEYRFQFSNIYQETAHVAGVRSSCGCTTPQITKSDLKTYEKSEIVATFNTRAFTGHHSATITVTFDKPFYAEVQLNVWGEIRSDVAVRPDQVDFGTIDQGTPVERRVTVTHYNRADWQVLDVRSINTHYEVEVVNGPRSGGTVSYDLIVRLKKDAPPGYLKDQLILITNDANAAQFPIEVEGLVSSELTVSPQVLALGAVEPGQKVTKNVIVRGRKPFRVTAAHCDDDAITCKLSDTANKIQLIQVTLTAGDKPGKLSNKLLIETDLGKSFAVEVVVQAEILPSDKPIAANNDKPVDAPAPAPAKTADAPPIPLNPLAPPDVDDGSKPAKPVEVKPAVEKTAPSDKKPTPDKSTASSKIDDIDPALIVPANPIRGGSASTAK